MIADINIINLFFIHSLNSRRTFCVTPSKCASACADCISKNFIETEPKHAGIKNLAILILAISERKLTRNWDCFSVDSTFFKHDLYRKIRIDLSKIFGSNNRRDGTGSLVALE